MRDSHTYVTLCIFNENRFWSKFKVGVFISSYQEIMLTENSFKNSKFFMCVLDYDLLSGSMKSMLNEHKIEAYPALI